MRHNVVMEDDWLQDFRLQRRPNMAVQAQCGVHDGKVMGGNAKSMPDLPLYLHGSSRFGHRFQGQLLAGFLLLRSEASLNGKACFEKLGTCQRQGCQSLLKCKSVVRETSTSSWVTTANLLKGTSSEIHEFRQGT